MGAITKGVTRLLGKQREGQLMGDGGHSPPDLSPELLQHIERQCALWEGICQRVSHNVTLLGTDNMVCYTEAERRELDLMIRNMQEFASRVDGALSAKVADMALSAQKALASYDDFCNGANGAAAQ